MAGPVFMAALAGALLGVVLSLGILTWLNDGELEYVAANSSLARRAGDAPDIQESLETLEAQVGRLRADVARLEAAAREGAESTRPTDAPEPTDESHADASPTDAGAGARRTATPEEEPTAEPPTRRVTATDVPEPTDAAEPTEADEPTATDEPTPEDRPGPRPTATLKIVP
jgi:hypothetical protein